jgi:D-serine deaminase-like pyridoxal phosphate-dependent protein
VRRLNQLREEIKTSVGGTQATFQICLLVDNVESLAFKELSPDPFSFYIKIDCGYNRAGVIVPSENWNKLLHHLQSNSKYADKLQGLYTHFGTSYGGNSPSEALRGLTKEIEALVEPAKSLKRTLSDLHHIVLSVGATPTATSIQNFSEISFSTEVAEFCQRTKKLRADGFLIEIHAGVYPTLDLQQLATRARSKLSGLSHHDIALTIQVEVVGRYFRNGKHEALVAAGSLALGREPCKSYPGWGVVVPRKRDGQFYSEDNAKGWIVGRISQEHGILVWEDPAGGAPLEPDDIFIGDILRIWPNHACIAGAMFDQYVVVDSDSNELEIIDIWNRCRGW